MTGIARIDTCAAAPVTEPGITPTTPHPATLGLRVHPATAHPAAVARPLSAIAIASDKTVFIRANLGL